MDIIKAIDVKIFPYRRLKPETTEELLNSIMKFGGILRVLVNGNSLPKIVGYGPAKGTPVNHGDRKVIKVKKSNFELVRLGNVCDITSSKRIFQDEYVNEGIPF